MILWIIPTLYILGALASFVTFVWTVNKAGGKPEMQAVVIAAVFWPIAWMVIFFMSALPDPSDNPAKK